MVLLDPGHSSVRQELKCLLAIFHLHSLLYAQALPRLATPARPSSPQFCTIPFLRSGSSHWGYAARPAGPPAWAVWVDSQKRQATHRAKPHVVRSQGEVRDSGNYCTQMMQVEGI